MRFQVHDIIDYFDDRRIATGLVLEADDRKLRVLNHQGKEAKISSNRVIVAGKDLDFPAAGSRDEQVAKIKAIFDLRDRIKGEVNLREVWEVVVSETQEIGLDDLSELVFGDKPDGDHEAAVLRAIFDDRVFFKIRPEFIEVYSSERVEQTLTQRDREREREMFTLACAEFLVRFKNREAETSSGAPERFFEVLEEAALLGEEWVTHKTAREIFSKAGVTPAWDPYRVLVDLGIWSEDENLRLRAEKVPIEFSAEAEAEAARCAARLAETGSREDLSHVPVVAIDSVTTRDVDDALSLSREGDKTVLGIHITDVAHFIDHNSPLDLEVRERGTSIYLPETTIPMVPRVLSEEVASLSVGGAQPVLSLLIEIGPDLRPAGFRLSSAMVKLRERLSYEETDERIQDPGSMEATLFAIARQLREDRVSRGALVFKDPEISVTVEETGEIRVASRNRETPSQVMVSEMMILANNLFGQILKESNLPALFRSQPPPSEKIDLGEGHDPVASYRSRKALVRVEMVSAPAPHSTLGLDCYTTATSPLRRYPDIVIQRQLKSVLDSSRPFLEAPEIEDIISHVSHPLDRASLMERERKKYFLLKYLRSKRDEEWEVIVLHRFPKFHLVQLTALGLNAAMKLSDGLSLKPYDRAIVRIDKINPRQDRLTLLPVKLL